VHEGALYLQPCATAAGPLPFCDRQRFGIWSVTKSASAALALLRMAQKFGPSILEERILDHVPIAAGHAGWAKVRLRDALDMATGVGFGSARRDPADSGDGYLDGNYAAWYEAASLEGKLRELAKAPDLPWGPGEVMRYRDQDTFLLGVAMDRLLKTRSGVAADVWGLLEEEVYGPIGIASAPTNRTLEADGGEGQPLMAYGFYPTLEDLARIAALLHAHGRHGGVQILHPELTAEVLAGVRPRGLPTGAVRGGVAQRYFRSFWYSRFEAGGCGLYVPEMQGWGGNIVALMPGGLTGIRIAGAIGDTRAVDDTTGMMRAGHALAPFCAEP
jgi:CubicO group peptidase (beta-lactamase class C family)